VSLFNSLRRQQRPFRGHYQAGCSPSRYFFKNFARGIKRVKQYLPVFAVQIGVYSLRCFAAIGGNLTAHLFSLRRQTEQHPPSVLIILVLFNDAVFYKALYERCHAGNRNAAVTCKLFQPKTVAAVKGGQYFDLRHFEVRIYRITVNGNLLFANALKAFDKVRVIFVFLHVSRPFFSWYLLRAIAVAVASPRPPARGCRRFS
jgi:hypothetical protein